MRTEAVITLLGDLETIELTSWIERGWVQPDPAGESWSSTRSTSPACA